MKFMEAFLHPKKEFQMFKKYTFIMLAFMLTNWTVGYAGDNQADARALAIDGGGVRGVFPAEILSLIHEDLGHDDLGNKRRICDFFKDGMTGTSTGSFIVLALACPFHKIREGEEQSTKPDAPLGFADGPYTPKDFSDTSSCDTVVY
jgi:hypothetical protein